jgi:hypothetical protein
MRGHLLPLLCLAACSTGPSEDLAVSLLVRSDKAVYSLTLDSAAQPVLLNRGQRPIYLPMNEYVAVEHLEAGTWQQGIAWFAVDGAGISFRVAPGDSEAALPMDFAYIERAPGQYRFVFEAALDSLGHQLLPHSTTTSAPFEVRP